METTLQENEKNGFNPFPGLRPFKIEESHLFFGREGQSDEVLLKLSQNRFVGIIGPSGSGKSSFVYCGVLPILYGGFLTEVSADWEVIVMRPGAGPIDNLAEALLRTDPVFRNSSLEEKKLKKTILGTLLRSSSLGLVEAIEQMKKSTRKNYLILVDQFEELFRFKDSREASAIDETLSFINLLLESINNKECPIYVSLTMRSDFIGECAQFAELTKKINDSNYLIPQMTREQKRKAIEGPVAVGHASITTRLVQRLLNDLGDNPDQLPILQHSLMRTWDYWSKYKDSDNEPIDIKHYESIGTMSEALSLHANEAFDELNENQKTICEQLFKAITERRGENFGIRRPTRMGEIAAIAQCQPEEVAEVIDKFRAPGRSLLMPAAGIPLTNKSVIDISHESLMRIWVRLKNWVEDEAEAVQMYIRLSDAAHMYQMGKTGLWRPPDLQLALNWQAKHKPTLIWAQRYHPAFERTMEFLNHSQREYETEQRIKELQAKRRLKTARVTAMVMAGLCVVAIGFLMYAFDQQSKAVEEYIRAEENRKQALENEKLAKENEQEALLQKDKADSAALVALEKEQIAKDSAESARIQRDSAAAARKKALENWQLAVDNEKLANVQKDSAILAREDAFREAQRAIAAELDATEKQYVSTAKAMALRSVQMEGETFYDTKGLLAQQAYIFNRNYNGYRYEGDIYNGLYFALKSYNNELTKTVEDVYNSVGDIFLAPAYSKNIIYSVNSTGKIISWRAEGLNRPKTDLYQSSPGIIIKAISLSMNDRYLVMGGRGVNSLGYAEILDLDNINNKTVITGLGTGILDLSYSSDQSIYLLDDNGHTIKQYKNGSVRDIAKSPDQLTSLSVSSDGRYIYTSTDGGKLLQWDTRNSFEQIEIHSGKTPITSVAVAPNSDLIAFGTQSGIMYLRKNGANIVIPSHSGLISSIAFSPDGNFMATSSFDKTVRLWNLQDLTKESVVLQDHNDKVISIAFTTDNSQIMASTYTRDIKFWPIQIEQMSGLICNYVTRNLLQEEWERYVSGIDYEITCPNVTTEVLKPGTPDE